MNLLHSSYRFNEFAVVN
uniref:Uncharacterized protein n=1 Tax=Anguilla anguilla TaxID=7936 RepID=A0A0E9UPA2_ANGAN